MAPEQLRNEPLDGRADLFSLGVVLYEMATGNHPHPQSNAPALIAAVLHDNPKPPCELNPAISPALEQVILRLMAKKREHRYQSARDLAAHLRQISTTSSGPAAAPSPTVVPRKRVLWASIAACVLLLAGALVWKFWPEGAETVRDTGKSRVAVLPFRPLSVSDADRELGLGLADAIVTGLGGSPDLIVRPTRAVLPYQDKTTDPIEAGKALQVTAILDGTLQRAGSRLRVNVQLWSVRDGTSLWSHKYDVESADVFGVQDQIGTSVAQALRAKLTDVSRTRLAAAPSKNAEVSALLLRGRSLELRQTREALQSAVALFEEAVQKEPDNASAHARLAAASRIYSFLHDPNNPKWLESAERHSRRALELDPNLAEAYAAAASMLWTPQRNFQHDRAMTLYRKALDLNPNLATDRGYYAVILSHVGLFDQAATQAARALESDPDNARALAEVAENLVMLGQAQRGEEAARAALRVEPDYLLSKMALLEALVVQNKAAEAQALLDQDYFGANNYFELWFAALLAAQRGRHAEAEKLGLQALQGTEGLGPFHHLTFGLAQVYALAGKNSQAVRWLRRTAETGMPCYPMFRDDPLLKNLKGDREYNKLLEEMRPEWERRRREF
jgi:TolB-like protein/Tfp pilus assembly protein PilF